MKHNSRRKCVVWEALRWNGRGMHQTTTAFEETEWLFRYWWRLARLVDPKHMTWMVAFAMPTAFRYAATELARADMSLVELIN